MFARLAYFGRLLRHGPHCLIAALDILACSRKSYVSLMRKDFATLFALRGAAFGLPDPAGDFAASLEFAAADQRRWKKLVVRSKLAYTSHFVLTRLGRHWSLDKMMLADCYRVPRLGVPLDFLGNDALVEGAPSYRCWCSLVSEFLPELFHIQRISMAFGGPRTIT